MENEKSSETFSTQLTRRLAAIERRHKRFINRRLAEGEMSAAASIPYRYVTAIKRHPGASQEFLADLFGVDKSRVARIVRSMEDGGYVRREFSPDNRRRYMLELTAEGETLYERIQTYNREWEARITRGIDDEALALTITTISQIIANLDGEEEQGPENPR